ncbi:tuberin [Lepidopterella palustris CBS 459.81]|uniref:Tuberin n=1 Tax=Lepidopterella palustris CBS 459.81 TaxID=1314670 RepID=A0A8E2E939_9PEZI|nr:tuberin [Lepidopterella palustris CBS 459.81]
MSPSPRDVPETPERSSSSSALFGAFRTLTGGRIKNPTPSTPSTSATLTPVQTPLLKPENKEGSVTSAPAARLNGGTEDGTPDSTEHGHHIANRRVVTSDVLGGPLELNELLEQLNTSRPLSDRIVAIRKICPILKEYPINNALILWSAASDLLDQEESSEATYAGYALLKNCVKLPDLSPIERNVFFNAISRSCDYKDFNIRFQALHELTGGGRNVEAFEPFVAPFLSRSLNSCFKAVREARRARKQKRSGPTLKEDDNLAQLFQYIIDVTRFNSKIFKEEDVELLLNQVMGICKETTQQADIEQAIRIFDTLITYTHIPTKSLKSCLEVLCDVHRQLNSLQDPTWNSLSNLFKSHVGQSSVSALLSILLDDPNSSGRRKNIPRGVVHVLQKLLLQNGIDGLPKVPISLLIPALKVSLAVDYEKHDADVVHLISAILSERDLTLLLLEEDDWSDLVAILDICARRTDTVSAPAMRSKNDCTSTSEPALPAELNADDRNTSGDDLTTILIALDNLREDMDFVQEASVMDLFMRLANRISNSAAESLVKYCAEERVLHPSNENWLESCRALLAKIYRDQKRPCSLRILIVKALIDTYNTVESICPEETVSQCAALILDNIKEETDIAVLHELVDFAVGVADRASDEDFADIINLLKAPLDEQRGPSPQPPTTLAYWASPAMRSREVPSFGSSCNILTTAFVRLFTRTLNQSAAKTRILFELLLHVAGSELCETDARITALKLLFRLRSDANHAIVVSSSSEGENIACVLCRTIETAVNPETVEDAPQVESKQEEQTSWRERNASSHSPHSSLTRHSTRSANATGRVSMPIPPLWMYPGPKGLPEEPSATASRHTFSYLNPAHGADTAVRSELKVALWLELIISLLQKAPDWEVYSYILVHLGPQLSNQSLFRNAVPQLKLLRSVVCEQIRASTFHEPPSYTLLKKADVAVCLFHILTILISYHGHYEKSEEDELVRSFLHGIGSWDRTSKWCIHALTVCCHEIPLSISKSLDNIIQKMSQIITQSQIAIHILEFLTSLARMPHLYKNFREDEFKMVFGVSFRYLQYVRDQRERLSAASASQSGHKTLRHSGASRDFASISEQKSRPKDKTSADDLPQYVYALAFHVITFWFMALKLPERRQQIPWITKNLIYTDRAGKEVTEEQSQVIMDIMQMVAYSDRDETAPEPHFAKAFDGDVSSKTWIVGLSLLTIETAARTGISHITSRRPCGTRHWSVRPLITQPPRHQVPITTGLASEAFYTSSYVGILPDDIFQAMYSPLHFPSVLGTLPDMPVALPQDDKVRRALDAFDRNPTVDGHKVGVIYIGEGQTNEKEILLNVMGSADYTAFLGDLGTLVRLKGAKFNAGGLDTRDDTDGEFTICWRDRVMEIVFHITTMMPTNLDDDQTWTNKKRHIGNDFVNIIFNDSGLPYNFDTFPSAFNYVHIVVTPEARASFVERRLEEDPDGRNRYYKVQVIPKPGFPEISPAAESKIISGRNIAAYCRLISINASVFSQVWYARDGGESISSWRNRLREIKRFRERYMDQESPPHTASPSSPLATHNLGGSVQGFSNSQARESVSGFKRTSVATFISEGTNRSSMLSGAVELEKQGSDGSKA